MKVPTEFVRYARGNNITIDKYIFKFILTEKVAANNSSISSCLSVIVKVNRVYH